MNKKTIMFLEEHGFEKNNYWELTLISDYLVPTYELDDPVYGKISYREKAVEYECGQIFFYDVKSPVFSWPLYYTLCFPVYGTIEQSYERVLDGIGLHLRGKVEIRPMEELLLKRLGYVGQGKHNGFCRWKRGDKEYIRFSDGWWCKNPTVRFISLHDMARAHGLKEMLGRCRTRILKEDARDVYERRNSRKNRRNQR